MNQNDNSNPTANPTGSSIESRQPTTDDNSGGDWARYDIVAIGNAIVDVITSCSDSALAEAGLVKGAMQLIDTAEAEKLYMAMGEKMEMSGGSVANSLAAMASLGRRCGFIGQTADDPLGTVFAHDLQAVGVDYRTAPLIAPDSPPSGRCLIYVTPDGQRTMNTFLGASYHLSQDRLDEAMIAAADRLYLEGYLWDGEAPRAAMGWAIERARAAGSTIIFTPSDVSVIDRHGDEFRSRIARDEFDILFANEAEALCLAQTEDLDIAKATLAAHLSLVVITRGAQGALALAKGVCYDIVAEPVTEVVDTTGAGDMFAAGFLNGLCEGQPINVCLKIGAFCAAIIIAQPGPRAQSDLKAALAAHRVGDLPKPRTPSA